MFKKCEFDELGYKKFEKFLKGSTGVSMIITLIAGFATMAGLYMTQGTFGENIISFGNIWTRISVVVFCVFLIVSIFAYLGYICVYSASLFYIFPIKEISYSLDENMSGFPSLEPYYMLNPVTMPWQDPMAREEFARHVLGRNKNFLTKAGEFFTKITEIIRG